MRVEGLLREAPQALAAVARRFGDFAEAEDAVQEAMVDAARQWPAQGLPESPTGWLVHVASRRMTERSPLSTPRHHGRKTPTGARSSPSTACSSR
jgi:predicted RNA polymerase sigma factor